MQELISMDPAKSADLVLLHLTDEVQQIISELQVSEANVMHVNCVTFE